MRLDYQILVKYPTRITGWIRHWLFIAH